MRSGRTDSGVESVLRRALRYTSARIGLVLLAAIVLLAVLGPALAPHGNDDIVSAPFEPPTSGYPLGTDTLGRDVLSRLLLGGHSILIEPTLATLLCYAIALPVGVVAGYRGGWLDGLLMRPLDLMVGIPFLIFVVILFTGFGSSPLVLIVGIGTASVPFAARMIRAATRDVAARGFVEAAVARGESTVAIVMQEIVPNLATFLVADATIRLSQSVLAVAALSFLGFGAAPPASDWAVMVNENRAAFATSPWAVVAPAVPIALFTVSVGLLADGLARASGRSFDRSEIVT